MPLRVHQASGPKVADGPLFAYDGPQRRAPAPRAPAHRPSHLAGRPPIVPPAQLSHPWRARLQKSLIEGASLTLFMVVLSTGAVALQHPNSPLTHLIPSPLLRRALSGLLAGGWLVGLIYSDWGQRSGAQINPAVTLTMLRLNRMGGLDAACYIFCQLAGSALGMRIAADLWGPFLRHPAVGTIVTSPGEAGTLAAFLAELVLSFWLMASIILTSDRKGWRRSTGLVVGLFILTLTVVAAPLSGLSLNPARSFGAAVQAGQFGDLWIYFVAPPLGMLGAAELLRQRDIRRSLKLQGKT